MAKVVKTSPAQGGMPSRSTPLPGFIATRLLKVLWPTTAAQVLSLLAVIKIARG